MSETYKKYANVIRLNFLRVFAASLSITAVVFSLFVKLNSPAEFGSIAPAAVPEPVELPVVQGCTKPDIKGCPWGKGVIKRHSLTKTMPSYPRVCPLQHSVLSVEMVPLPAGVHPASYQAMLIAYHHMGVPVDPRRLPQAPYASRYYPYYQLPVEPVQTYDELRVDKGKRLALGLEEGKSLNLRVYIFCSRGGDLQ